MPDTDITREARELCEQLRKMLPEKVSYADMVGAEKFMGDMYVYEDPEPYIIEDAASHMDALLDLLAAKDTEIARLTVERTAMIINAGNIDCDSCKHNGIGDCEDIAPDCRTCAQDCPCKPCDGTSNWEWRGAEEG